jgi:hypothetical protein
VISASSVGLTRLAGVLSCYDRIIITGTLPGPGARRE